MKNALTQSCVVAQNRRVRIKQTLQNFARPSPGGPPKREKLVKRILREGMPILKFWGAKMPEFLENRKIDDQLSNRHTDACCALPRFKNSERKILNWKMRIGSDIDKSLQRHSEDSRAPS